MYLKMFLDVLPNELEMPTYTPLSLFVAEICFSRKHISNNCKLHLRHSDAYLSA